MYGYLKEKGGLAVLSDANVVLATKEVLANGRSRPQINKDIRKKVRLIPRFSAVVTRDPRLCFPRERRVPRSVDGLPRPVFCRALAHKMQATNRSRETQATACARGPKTCCCETSQDSDF